MRARFVPACGRARAKGGLAIAEAEPVRLGVCDDAGAQLLHSGKSLLGILGKNPIEIILAEDPKIILGYDRSNPKTIDLKLFSRRRPALPVAINGYPQLSARQAMPWALLFTSRELSSPAPIRPLTWQVATWTSSSTISLGPSATSRLSTHIDSLCTVLCCYVIKYIIGMCFAPSRMRICVICS
ncbi:hypothetical protein PYCCODRAFT_316204 [Trametes coccinea BRFM310]|uniref:Uncharacterized protein n=1 Tax=Trametes coccinea (strain BRFM310) TaxID=1353009 RepID=A0A1Y2IP45_TRAC3|nr:hypothetical protein PYCCODRAFT_316204 [Trametes coccinea BRFM310]